MICSEHSSHSSNKSVCGDVIFMYYIPSATMDALSINQLYVFLNLKYSKESSNMYMVYLFWTVFI